LRKYETIIVIDSLLKLEEIEGIISKYERFISANGGQVEAVDRWGKRRLAYEIKKRQYGFYVLIRFDAPPAMIKQLDREYRLNEFLLRTMTTLLDKRALKALAKQYVAAQAAAAAAPAVEAPAVEPVVTEEPAVETVVTEEPAVEPVAAIEEATPAEAAVQEPDLTVPAAE
jgi:small subunit ribosomal protein S6